MKDLKKIIAFVLVLVLTAGTMVFAEGSIVSPAANSITTSDSLLISVKLNQPGTVRVKVFEEKIEKKSVVTSVVSGQAVTHEAISYTSVNTSTFEAIDFTSNPALSTYADVSYQEPAEYTSKDTIGFYTKQLSDVKPGIYKVVVEDLNDKKEVVSSTSALTVVKTKPAATENKVFTNSATKTSALTILQNFLKSLFK